MREIKLETWEDYEKTCARARVALADFPQRPRDPLRQEKRCQAERTYEVALKELQDYLTRRYGWAAPLSSLTNPGEREGENR